MNAAKKTRRNIFPVSTVLRSLRLFILLFAFFAECYTITCGRVDMERLMSMLPLAAGYAVAALIARRTDNKLLITLGGVILAALAYAFGTDTMSWIFNGVIAAFGFGSALNERVKLKRNADRPDNIFYAFAGLAILAVLLLVSWISENGSAGQLIFTIIMIYFPIAFGAWLYEGIEFYLAQFAGHSSQPVGLVRRHISGWAVPSILTVSVVAALLPYRDGKTLAHYVYLGLMYIIGYIIKFFIWLISLFPELEGAGQEVSSSQLAEEQQVYIHESGSNTLASVIALIILGAFILSIVVSLLKKLIELLRAGYAARPSEGENPLGDDVVERIDPKAMPARRGLFARQTAAEKIRAVYRGAVSKLYKYGVSPRVSDSPDEICAAAREKGCDLGELTEIYKLARYSPDCSEELLRRAKQLARRVEPERTGGGS